MNMNLSLGIKMKKLFSKNNVMPLVLVSFLIVMLSMCYRNQNHISAVGNSLFEGFNEEEDDGDGDTFKGGFQEGDECDENDQSGCFTGHRQGFRGRRQGFRSRREGLKTEPEKEEDDDHDDAAATVPGATSSNDTLTTGSEAFRGRREGFKRRKHSPRNKLGFFGLKKSGSKKSGFRGRRGSQGRQGFVGARFQGYSAGGGVAGAASTL